MAKFQPSDALVMADQKIAEWPTMAKFSISAKLGGRGSRKLKSRFSECQISRVSVSVFRKKKLKKQLEHPLIRINTEKSPKNKENSKLSLKNK